MFIDEDLLPNIQEAIEDHIDILINSLQICTNKEDSYDFQETIEKDIAILEKLGKDVSEIKEQYNNVLEEHETILLTYLN